MGAEQSGTERSNAERSDGMPEPDVAMEPAAATMEPEASTADSDSAAMTRVTTRVAARAEVPTADQRQIRARMAHMSRTTACETPAEAAAPDQSAPSRSSTGLDARGKRPSSPIKKPSSASPSKRFVRPPSPSKRPAVLRAQALFYDDNLINFEGNNTRGKVPAIRTVHCPEPLTLVQLESALEMSAGGDTHDGAAPQLFYFFDFDDTLSLQSGVDPIHSSASIDRTLVEIFGDAERRRVLCALLGSLLQTQRCFILTANQGYAAIAQLLNMLLARGASDSSTPPRFVVDQTVRYTPTGTKIRAITKIVEGQGLTLAPSF